MTLFLLLLQVVVSMSFIIPVPTNSHRCMIIYSMNPEDTIKVTIKFPKDPKISEFYDYLVSINDLKGNIIKEQSVEQFVFKEEVKVPNSTF